MKLCNKCNTEKLEDCFYKNKSSKDGLQRYCKVCSIVNSKKYYKDQKLCDGQYIKNFKLNTKLRAAKLCGFVDNFKRKYGCLLCLETESACLDFHHVSGKDVNVSYLIHSKSLKRLVEEVGKCVLVCSNCHRKIHAKVIVLENIKLISSEYFLKCWLEWIEIT